MGDTIKLEIVTPERLLLSDEVDEVIAPGYIGEFGVLPDHTPFLTLLDIGTLQYRKKEVETTVVVTGGFAEILDNKVVILARTAEFSDEIDVERAKRALAKAESGLEDLSLDDENYIKLEAKLRRAMVRLRVSG